MFHMSGDAKIFGNAAQIGGGVYVESSGRINKTGGIIYGSDGGGNSNIATNGDGYGHAVAFGSSASVSKKRDLTAGTGVNLDSSTDVNWD
jgi:hypothetical protein